MFGTWQKNTNELHKKYSSSEPFPNVIIDNFFEDDFAKKLVDAFPELDDTWYKYWNPIEKKYAKNKFTDDSLYTRVFDVLQTDEFVNLVRQITGIENLESDPHLHGAGVHYHPRGGKLDMHLDYSIHPITGKERRVNIIIYLNRDWKEEYGGAIELWNKEFTGPVQKIYPIFNRAVLFQTSDISYHGIPTPMQCPEGEGRKSIAIYYVSEPRKDVTHRLKAEFRPLPWQPVNSALAKLYEIRPKQVLTPDILREVYPTWEKEGAGFW